MSLPVLDGSDRITNSRMAAYKTCQRKHHLAYTLGIRSDQSSPLRMGSAFHHGLDLLSTGTPSRDAADTAVSAAYASIPDWCATAEQQHDWMIEAATVDAMISGWAARYSIGAPLEPRLEISVVVASELPFDLPIINPESGKPSRTYRVAGKIDRIARMGDGRLALVEHKTASESIDPGADYWRKLQIDQQISLYVLAARQLGHPVETVIYDVARKPAIAPKAVPVLDSTGQKIVVDAAGSRVYLPSGKPRQSAAAELGYSLSTRQETPDEFQRRLGLDMIERPDFYFARREIPRLGSDIALFAEELWQIAEQMRESERKGRAFRNTQACGMYGRCPYLDICHLDINASSVLPSGLVRVSHIHPELQGV
jgi:hypothetical protein